MGADGFGKFSHPGFSSIDALEEALGEHQAEVCNAITFTEIENSVTIGVIDSLYDPTDEFREHFDVNRTRDLLSGSLDADTTGHGSVVSKIITKYAKNFQFNFYRVAQPNGRIQERHLINAIGYAHLHDDVDILNLSAGNDHSEDGSVGCARHHQPCKVREAALKAINDGIHVAAAAGNSDQYDSVCCPSLQDKAISVGGFISKCTQRLPSQNHLGKSSEQIKPPLACWIPGDEHTVAYCSGNDCSPDPDHDCMTSMENVNWSGNVDPVWNKPDILAPAAWIVRTDPPQIVSATSWAAPIVTAVATEIIAGARYHGKDVPPYLLRRALRDTATQLDSGEKNKKLHAENALYYVFDQLDLSRPERNQDFDFDRLFDNDN